MVGSLFDRKPEQKCNQQKSRHDHKKTKRNKQSIERGGSTRCHQLLSPKWNLAPAQVGHLRFGYFGNLLFKRRRLVWFQVVKPNTADVSKPRAENLQSTRAGNINFGRQAMVAPVLVVFVLDFPSQRKGSVPFTDRFLICDSGNNRSPSRIIERSRCLREFCSPISIVCFFGLRSRCDCNHRCVETLFDCFALDGFGKEVFDL